MAVKQFTELPERARQVATDPTHPRYGTAYKRVRGGGNFKCINDPMYAKALRLATKFQSKTAQGNILRNVLDFRQQNPVQRTARYWKTFTL